MIIPFNCYFILWYYLISKKYWGLIPVVWKGGTDDLTVSGNILTVNKFQCLKLAQFSILHLVSSKVVELGSTLGNRL